MSEIKEITVETERLLVIRRRYQAVEAWCESCTRPTIMIRPDQAAALTGKTIRAIFQDLEQGRLHFHEPPGGLLVICLESLLGAQVSLPESRSVPPRSGSVPPP